MAQAKIMSYATFDQFARANAGAKRFITLLGLVIEVLLIGLGAFMFKSEYFVVIDGGIPSVAGIFRWVLWVFLIAEIIVLALYLSSFTSVKSSKLNDTNINMLWSRDFTYYLVDVAIGVLFISVLGIFGYLLITYDYKLIPSNGVYAILLSIIGLVVHFFTAGLLANTPVKTLTRMGEKEKKKLELVDREAGLTAKNFERLYQTLRAQKDVIAHIEKLLNDYKAIAPLWEMKKGEFVDYDDKAEAKKGDERRAEYKKDDEKRAEEKKAEDKKAEEKKDEKKPVKNKLIQ